MKNLIYKRYYDTMNDCKNKSILDFPNQLFEIYSKNPNEANLIALMGCLDSILSENPDTNFSYITNLYKLFDSSSKKKLVVQLAKIPCANCGYELRNLINDYSDEFTSAYILGKDYHSSYNWSLFRKFPCEYFWETDKEKCIELIKKADIIHVHHDWFFEETISYMKNKPIILSLYDISSSSHSSYIERVKKYATFLTVADQPLQKEIYKNLSTYILPIVRFLFNENTNKNNSSPIVVFAPTIKNLGKNLPLCSKKREEILPIIEKLKKELNFEFDLIEGIPYEENLDRKRKADIIIDDMNDGFEEFHCTSLESVCFGAIPLTSYSGKDYPFVKTNIKTLESTLRFYINNPEELRKEQNKIINWRKTVYTPENLLLPYETLYQNLLKSNPIPQSIIETYIDRDEKIKPLFDILNQNKIYYWIAKNTLLNIFKNREIDYNTIQLGTNQREIKEIILDLTKNCNTKIEIEIKPKQEIKPWKFKNIDVFVPKPITKYLEKFTGKPFKHILTDG